jgi:hypothetical protein
MCGATAGILKVTAGSLPGHMVAGMNNPIMSPLAAPVATSVADAADSADSGSNAGADAFCHASGRICVNCDRRIEDRQPARRKATGGWVHDVCPPVIN